ncbi:MAG TPA: VWA domain-containing protein [Chitinophagales bacterium]|nr:VWA domain-containing protein [Chitinophagales bacterium]
MQFEFANPYFLWLLGIIPVSISWYVWKNRRQQASFRVSTISRLHVRAITRVEGRHSLFALRMIACAALIIACARPQKSFLEEIINSEGIDIMLTLDVSGSMMSADVKPNRLEAAKQVADSFISKRPNDRIGLVLFAEEAFTASPVTIDHAALSQIVNGVHTMEMADGTAIGMGLGTATNHLKEIIGKSRVIILITDGENNAGTVLPLEAAQLAHALGIRVYTIGLLLDNLSNSLSEHFKLPSNYINGSQLLQRISEITGGKFFLANDKKGLESVFREIDLLEKTKADVRSYQRYSDFFFPFALFASLALLLEILLRFTYFKSVLS